MSNLFDLQDMDRTSEISALLSLTPKQVMQRAGNKIVVCDDLESLHRRFADDIVQDIRSSQSGNPVRLILPVGPTGQYPYLADIINREQLDFTDCLLFFMDEHCDESGKAFSAEHPLSFRGIAEELFLSKLENPPRANHVVFPGHDNIDSLAEMIAGAGGIDTCYGGIGIHGHVAYNEPEPGIKDMGPRRVRLNDFTVTINAVRAHMGGNLEGYPRYGFTLGMKEILGARKIRLYCRNGCEFDWANTVLRLALFGEPGDDYPVTHIRNKDYTIITDRDTLASPKIVL